VIYGTVNAEVARTIVRRHIMGKELVNEHIFDRPAPDIVEDGQREE
jgi:NADP-reducing hydrogenase subunit HndB